MKEIMLTKNSIILLLNRMPETFSAEDIIEEIILLKKIETALEQVKNGEYLTSEELDREIDTWD